MQKILSVSVAAYNIEKFIESCLTPFSDNIFKDSLEVLIVDDGSNDNTAVIAKQYQEKYPSIFRYIKKENGGWGSTINKGITVATGKYFKQLDGDDFFVKENLIRYLEFLKNIDTDVVYTDYATFRDGKTEPFEQTNYMTSFECDRVYKYDDITIPKILPEAMHTLTVKTSLLRENYEQFKITEHCFYTDVEYWIKTIYLATDFCYYRTIIYMYRVGETGQSISKVGILKHYKEHRKVLENCIIFLRTNVMSDAKSKILLNRLTTMVANQYQFYLSLPIGTESKKELLEFDEWIDNNASDMIPVGWKRYELLKKTRFLTYKFAAKYVQKTLE